MRFEAHLRVDMSEGRGMSRVQMMQRDSCRLKKGEMLNPDLNTQIQIPNKDKTAGAQRNAPKTDKEDHTDMTAGVTHPGHQGRREQNEGRT